MNLVEVSVFVVYLIFVLAIGVYFFIKSKEDGDKSYFLGDRQMSPWVTALSAGASDMGADGPAHLHLRSGSGADLDQRRPPHRLLFELDL